MYGWFDFSNSSNAGVFGVSALCGSRGEKQWWRRWLVKPLWRLGNRCHNAKWWLQYRLNPRHKYHLIDTGLEPGYHDADYLMLHGCFALLCRYVEKEHDGVDSLAEWAAKLQTAPDKNAPEGWQEAQGTREAEVVALYRWWKDGKPADQAEYDRMLHHLYSDPWETYTNDDGQKVFGSRLKYQEGDKEMRDSMWELEAKMQEDEQQMLKRLIDIRGGLWT